MFCKRRCVLRKAAVVSEQPFIDPLQNMRSWIKFTGKNLCWSLFLIKLQLWEPATLLKKAPTQVFSCEICKLFKNNYFEEHLWTSASKHYLKRDSNSCPSCEFCKFFKNTYFLEDLRTACPETPVRGSFFKNVASLTA